MMISSSEEKSQIEGAVSGILQKAQHAIEGWLFIAYDEESYSICGVFQLEKVVNGLLSVMEE